MHLLDSYNGVSRLLTLAILALLFFWFYKKYIGIYTQFRIKFLLPELLYRSLLGKIPKRISRKSFYFQRICETVKEFQSEGICVLWLLKPYVFLYSEEAIKIFSNSRFALRKATEYEALHDLFGNGLTVSNGDVWKQRRKMLNPVFNALVLKDSVPVLNRNAATLVEELQKISHETSINMLKFLKFCAFSNICESILGLEMNCPEKQTDIKRFINLITVSSGVNVKRIMNPWLLPKYVLWFLPRGRHYLRKQPEIQQFTANVLEEMKESVLYQSTKVTANKSKESSNAAHRSVFQTLLEYHVNDPSFTMKDMLDEVNTLILAGYDTIASAMQWILFLLGHHPDVQDSVYRELEATVENEELSNDDLLNLKYMDCVVKESLRLYPPIPLFGRCLEKDIQCGKYTVPSGTTIVFFPFMSLRDPKIYPDPEKFKPERFLDGGLDKKTWTYIPFAEGIRSCIGKRFALMEIKVILAHILKIFKVTSLDRIEDVHLRWEIVLAPVKPLQMRLTPRK